VNPNGAPTTYKWEYGPTTALGSETESVSVGEGTSSVKVYKTLQGLLPNGATYFRVSATNSYGTSVSKTLSGRTAYWAVKSGTFPQSFSQGGSITFNMPTVGNGSTIECGIGSGGGTIEAETAFEKRGYINAYELSFKNCVWVGSPGCNPTSISPLKLNSALRSTAEKMLFIDINTNTCGWFDMTLVEQEPFRITKMPSTLYGNAQTMEFAGNTKFGTNPIEITGVLNITATPGVELTWFWS